MNMFIFPVVLFTFICKHLFNFFYQICFSYRCDVQALSNEREKLMKKLIEVEMDGQAAVKQVNEMREGFRRLREVSFSPPPPFMKYLS